MKVASLIALLSCLILINCQTFNLIKHDILSEASGPRCLDGSPAAMYIDIGSQTDNFMIFFEGGGLCRGDGLNNMLDYCLQRSTTNLGSSKGYAQKSAFNNYVFLNPDPKTNPTFHNWTRVFVPYCDGSLHQGFKSTPVDYKGKKLYFRGENNTKAHFDYLSKNYNLFSAKKIVIAGTSAGAVATYSWGNYVYNQAVNKNSVYLIPDSGIFLIDFVNPWNNKTMEYYTSSLFNIVFEETKMPTSECMNAYGNILDCFKAGNLHQILKAKTLVVQSTYDAWGLEQILGLSCLTYPIPSSIQKCPDSTRIYIEQYHQKLQQNIANFTKEERHGVWSIGCVQHGFVDTQVSYQSPKYLTPYPNGVTLYETVRRFLNGQKVNEIDSSTWPDNKGCNGLSQLSFLKREIEHLQ